MRKKDNYLKWGAIGLGALAVVSLANAASVKTVALRGAAKPVMTTGDEHYSVAFVPGKARLADVGTITAGSSWQDGAATDNRGGGDNKTAPATLPPG